jgi:hypothetical protein
VLRVRLARAKRRVTRGLALVRIPASKAYFINRNGININTGH